MLDKPWIPYLAKEYLDTIVKSDMRVFEYGCGGSTLYFSERVKSVISVEHDIRWYDKFELLDNVMLRLMQCDNDLIGDDKSNPEHYTSGPFLKNFKSYVSVIDQYDPFDIIFIDGRSRASCLMHASKRVNPGGWIILDNSERDYYLKNTRCYFDGWETVEFFGYGPYLDWPWKTLFMRNHHDIE